MGSIISAIEDKIREHGSYDKYLEHLKKTAFVPERTVGPASMFPASVLDIHGKQDSIPLKPYPVFEDSKGNEVWDGSIIRIIEHATCERLNRTTARVKWLKELGRYEYFPDDSTCSRSFDLVTNFVVIK